MRIDFHCHIFHNGNAFQAFKLYNQKFSGYGFYKRVLKMLEGINTINTDDIIRKTPYHLERGKIDKVVMLPVSEKENELKNPIIKLQKQKEIIIFFFFYFFYNLKPKKIINNLNYSNLGGRAV